MPRIPNPSRALCLVLLLCVRLSSTQQPAAVQGTVTDLVSGQPLPNVRVTLSADSGNAYGLSDVSGRFTIDDAPPGEYRVQASREGYFWSRSQSGPPALVINAGQKLQNLSIKLLKASAITGRVIDERGNPAASVSVMASRLDFRNGRRVLNSNLGSTAQTVSTTNRNGEYRLFGLEPGQYYLSSGSVYYPGTADPNLAIPLTVPPGRDLPAPDLQLVSLGGRYTVQFATSESTAADTARGAYTVFARSSDPARLVPDVRLTSLGGNRFQTSAMLPGDYELDWVAPLSGLWGRLAFNIKDSNVDAGVMTLSAGITLTGRIQMQDPRAMTLVLMPADGSTLSRSTSTSGDGMFSVTNVPPGDYWIYLQAMPRDAYIQAVRYALRPTREGDITVGKEAQGPLEIVVAPSGSVATGTVRNASGDAVPFAPVLVFPARTDRMNPNFIKTVETDARGAFRVYGLGPGEYRALAWDEKLPALHRDSRFLSGLEARAGRLTVSEKLATSVDLRVIVSGN